jgi:hypothetical protein
VDSHGSCVLVNFISSNSRQGNFLDFGSPIFHNFHSFLSLLEEKFHSPKLLICPSICCLDFLGSNDIALLDALIYDENHTSFRFKCCLVFSMVFFVVLIIFDIPLHLP